MPSMSAKAGSEVTGELRPGKRSHGPDNEVLSVKQFGASQIAEIAAELALISSRG
jgi:hypothetical protein